MRCTLHGLRTRSESVRGLVRDKGDGARGFEFGGEPSCPKTSKFSTEERNTEPLAGDGGLDLVHTEGSSQWRRK